MNSRSARYQQIAITALLFVAGCDARTPEEKNIARDQMIKDLGLPPNYSPIPVTPTNASNNAASTPIEPSKGADSPSNSATSSVATAESPSQNDRSSNGPAPWIDAKMLPRETWEVQYRKNEIVGYLHRKIDVSKTQGTGVYRCESDSRIRTMRKGKEFEQHLSVSALERNTGELMSFVGDYQAGDEKRSFQGNVNGNKLRITTTISGKPNAITEIPWKPEYRGPFAIEQSMLRKPMRPKEVRDLQMIDPLQAKVIDARLEASEPIFTTLLNRQPEELLEVRATCIVGEVGLETLYWTTKEGEILKSMVLSQDLRSYRTEQDMAKMVISRFDLNAFPSRDVTLFGPAEKIGSESQITYRIEHRSTDPKQLFSPHGGQRIRSLDARTIELTVFDGQRTIETNNASEADPANDPRYLTSSRWIESDDPQIVRLSQLLLTVRGLEENSEASLRARAFQTELFKRFQGKEFDRKVSSATEALQAHEGDCVEHALLLAAVCRANAIPARIAMGLVVKNDGPRPSMKFHTWVEFHDGSRWLPLDSTQESSEVKADRIKVLETPLDAINAYEPILAVFRATSELDISVLP